MASWKRVITNSDDADYKNSSLTLAQLDTALDGASNYGANKILKVNGAGSAIIWADDSGGIALTDLSVGSEGTASGNGGISYANGTGVFTYAPPASATASATGLATAAQITKLDAIADTADNYDNWTFGGDTSASGLAAAAFQITNSETFTIAGGDSIATHRTSNTLTINNEDPCDETHVKNVLAALDSTDTLYIGDSGNDATINIRGNLNVTGTTTTVDTETILLADNNIVLNSNYTGASPTDGGITVERGTVGNVALNWDESANIWSVQRKNVNSGNGTGIITQNIVTSSTAASAPNVNVSYVGQIFVDSDDDSIHIYS